MRFPVGIARHGHGQARHAELIGLGTRFGHERHCFLILFVQHFKGQLLAVTLLHGVD